MSKPHGIALPRIGFVSLNVFYLLILGGCTATEQKAWDDLLNGVSDQVQNQVQNQGAAVAAPTKEVCAIVNPSQALSREDYGTLTASFVSVPMRSIPESQLVQLAGSPYCQLSDGLRADGSTYERRAYRLASDDSHLLVVAYVSKKSVVGWGFLFEENQTMERHDADSNQGLGF